MAPLRPEDIITYFAETDARSKRVQFGIKSSDRTRHMYIIGKTGMGKSTMLENMAIQDIKNGEGLAFIDPHGKTAELLLDYVPEHRTQDVLYFAPFDLEYPISFNVMEDVGYERRHLVANGLMSAFKKIWVDAWSARMEYILNNILLSLLEFPDSTLIGVNRMLVDKEYRNKVVENISDPSVKAFWTDEFAKYGERYMQEAGAAIQNKIGQFISNPLVRNIIGQPKSTFDIRKIMDEKKILIINLSKGRVGESNANLLGSMLITKIYLAAMSRADSSQAMLKGMSNFYLYVDEFQSFANESFADILSEARKYKLNLTIAHQYIEQMSDEVRAAVFGNVGSMIVFRVGAIDAEVLEKEFFPTFTKEDLVNLGFVQIYLKLMIDGVTSAPFSATTLPPIERPDISFKEDIVGYSRDTYAHPRAVVEEAIKKWHEAITPQRNRKPDENKKLVFPKPAQESASVSAPAATVAATRPVQPVSPSVPSQPTAQSAKDTSKERAQAQVQGNKELELRSVIAKSYETHAETTKPQPKRDDKKSPTPQNISALRDALAAVIKDVPQASVPAPRPAPVIVHAETNNVQNIKQFNQTINNNQPAQKATVPPLSPRPQIPTAKKEAESTPQKASESKAPAKEVPEHVLRKILEL